MAAREVLAARERILRDTGALSTWRALLHRPGAAPRRAADVRQREGSPAPGDHVDGANLEQAVGRPGVSSRFVPISPRETGARGPASAGLASRPAPRCRSAAPYPTAARLIVAPPLLLSTQGRDSSPGHAARAPVPWRTGAPAATPKTAIRPVRAGPGEPGDRGRGWVGVKASARSSPRVRARPTSFLRPRRPPARPPSEAVRDAGDERPEPLHDEPLERARAGDLRRDRPGL